jgi:ribonucleoside-diphosphate reductase alpha chain
MYKTRQRGKEPLNIEKIHDMVEYACEDITGVSSSQVEMNSGLQFYDGITTDEIQQILIKSAADLISLENPNYQYVAARLLLYSLRKQVIENFGIIHTFMNTLKNVLKKKFTIKKF